MQVWKPFLYLSLWWTLSDANFIHDVQYFFMKHENPFTQTLKQTSKQTKISGLDTMGLSFTAPFETLLGNERNVI